MRCRIAIAVLLAPAALCRADINPIQGMQSMSGAARVIPLGGGSPKEDTFDVSAPDPLASWAPPTQDVSVSTSLAASHVVANYASTIGPGALRLETRVQTDGSGVALGGFGWGCQFEWDQPFFLKFTLTAPGVYLLGGQLRHQASGYVTPNLPVTLTFGPEGGSPLVALNIPASPPISGPPVVSEYAPAPVSLPAGTYVLQARSATGPITSAHSPNFIDVRMYFLMTTCEGAYADCDLSGTLTVADFGCFQTRFVAGDPYADCNASGTITIADFGCFQTKYVAGCP